MPNIDTLEVRCTGEEKDKDHTGPSERDSRSREEVKNMLDAQENEPASAGYTSGAKNSQYTDSIVSKHQFQRSQTTN
jgi:hypothetical protein